MGSSLGKMPLYFTFMDYNKDFERFDNELQKLSEAFIRSGSSGIFLKTENQAYYKQLLTELVDFIDEVFGEENHYSKNIINTANSGYGGFFGGPSKASILEVQALTRAAYSQYKRKLSKNEPLKSRIQKPDYINSERIEEIGRLSSTQFDVTRLLGYCREINQANQSDSFLTIALLLRAIIDHIPPIFGFKNFSEVVNNYNGGKSFKELMERLDKSSRKLADIYLHKQISKKESLPNFTQINYSAELDILLSEIINQLK